jgi:hypothetical protein
LIPGCGEPYDRVKDENPEARAAAQALVEEGKKAGPGRKTFVFVNNGGECAGDDYVGNGGEVRPKKK